MAHFKKRSSGIKTQIPVVSMPDIVFILLIFFMVTTQINNLDLKVNIQYTRAQNVEKITQKRRVTYIYVGPQKMPGTTTGGVAIQIDDAIIDNIGVIQSIMVEKYRDQPNLIVSLRVDKNVKSGIVLDIQHQLQLAGTLRLNYSVKQEGEGL